MTRPDDAEAGPPAAPEADHPPASRTPPTDAQRYQWIRANRGNTVIAEALRAAHFDDDFDQQIDAAMQAQSDGLTVGRMARAEHPFGRRRSDFE